jgi:WD40 repeat protein
MIQFDGHTVGVHALAFSPDSGLLATAGRDGSVRLWDAGGGVVREFAVPGGAGPLAWEPSGRRLVCGTEGGLFELRMTGEVIDLRASPMLKPVATIAFLSDELLAVGGGVGIHLFDVPKRSARNIAHYEQKGVKRLVAHRESKTVAWTTGEHRLRVWKTTSPDKLDVPLGKPSFALDVSPDGTHIAVGVDYTVRLYPIGERYAHRELAGHKGRVTGAAFTADGRTLATASWDDAVRLWDVATAKEKARFPLAVGKLTGIAASPDGTRLAVAGSDGPVVLIDTE